MTQQNPNQSPNQDPNINFNNPNNNIDNSNLNQSPNPAYNPNPNPNIQQPQQFPQHQQLQQQQPQQYQQTPQVPLHNLAPRPHNPQVAASNINNVNHNINHNVNQGVNHNNNNINKQGNVLNKKWLIILLSLGLIFLLSVSILGFLIVQNRSNSTVITPNSSVKSSDNSSTTSSSTSKTALYFPRFFNPTDGSKSQMNNSNNSSQTTQSTSRSLPKTVDIALTLKNNDNVDKKVHISESCSDNTTTTHGLTQYRSRDNNGTSLTVGSKLMILSPRDQGNFDRSVNFISRNTDLMSDNESTFGPDFLQFMRVGCSSSVIQRVRDIENVTLADVNIYRSIIDIRGNGSAVDIGINIYAKKDDIIMLFQSVIPYSQFFSKETSDACSQNGVAARACLKEKISSDSESRQKMEAEVKRLLTIYAI
jgi:hypothetical protein